MKLDSVAVLGGGPGGLYAARLIKLRHPRARVQVHEQGSPDLTFGFGVGLATRTQRNLQAADPATLTDIVDHAWEHDMSMSVAGHRVRLPLGNLLAIGRSTLLEVLQRHATEAGVELHFGSRVTAEDLDADLVIAADGVSSVTREQHADTFGASVDTDHGWYLWCGTDFALPSAVFAPVTTDVGTFVTHAYPYAADRSTFLVETDEQTWRRAGFDATTAATPYDADDTASLDYLGDAFTEELQGHRLIGNRTRWTQFRTVRCQQWHHGRIVLLGDAAHTAHYSIGSGTKLAMEDAIVLDQVIADADSLEAALSAYEEQRRPAVEHLQETAGRSMRWWHSFDQRLDQPVEQLFLSYMTRAGKVSVERFAESAPDVVRRGLAAYAGSEPPTEDLEEWVLAQPWTRGRHTSPTRHLADLADVVLVTGPDAGRTTDAMQLIELPVALDDPSGPAGDRVLREVTKALEGDCDGVLLSTADDLESVLTMLETAERVRRETGAVVAARASSRWHDHLASALATDRIDLVDLLDHDGDGRAA